MFDLDKVNRAHKAAFDLAVELNKRVAVKYEGSDWNLVARAALLTISHDSLCFHRAIGDLGYSGWAFAAPVLLRTLMEGMLSALAITQSDRPNLAGFKFFYAYVKDIQTDPNLLGKTKKEIQNNSREHMKQLSEEDQRAAKEYLYHQKLGAFWYSDEFGRPTKLIETFGDKEQVFVYRKLSAAAHFGFIGLRLFRDNPDDLNVAPREDRKAIGMTMLSSSRFIGEIARIRAIFEDTSIDTEHSALMTQIMEAAKRK